jgi:hypothetical protein
MADDAVARVKFEGRASHASSEQMTWRTHHTRIRLSPYELYRWSVKRNQSAA